MITDTTPGVQKPGLEIKPPSGWSGLDLSEVWQYRELLHFLTLREIKVRYAQTSLGIAWVVIQPLAAMVIFSLFLGKLGKIPSDGLPYPLFVFSALVPWTFFSNALLNASNGLVNSAHLITKVYFPRLLLPLSSVTASLLDLAIMMMLLFGMMMYYGVSISFRLWWLPALVLLAAMCALGLGLFLSALNVEYRDVKHTIPFLLQIWMFATPVAYPSSLVPDRWRSVYALNPLVTVIDGFRWALLGGKPPLGSTIAASSVTVSLCLLAGAFYFRRVEKTFADVI